jgi:hypothetical protein
MLASVMSSVAIDNHKPAISIMKFIDYKKATGNGGFLERHNAL